MIFLRTQIRQRENLLIARGGKKSLRRAERIKYEASVNKTEERGGKARVQRPLQVWELVIKKKMEMDNCVRRETMAGGESNEENEVRNGAECHSVTAESDSPVVCGRGECGCTML